MGVAGVAWWNEGLLPLCESLPAKSLARLCCSSKFLHASVSESWTALRPLRAASLRDSIKHGFLRMHRLEQSLLYEEFGDISWEKRWQLDGGIAEEDPSWRIGDEGLELSGLSGRLLDLHGNFCPPVAAFSVAVHAVPAEAAMGYIVLQDDARRPCAWIYFEWIQDRVGAPGQCLWINDQRIVLMDWPWPTSLKLSFEIDWAAKELTDIRINGSRAMLDECVEFHNPDCCGVRYVALSSRRGSCARARWEVIQLWAERKVTSDPQRRIRPPFLNMLL